MQGTEGRFERVVETMSHPRRVRNVTIVAHVDHGKTTLADCLLASNGLIHRKQAGQLKLLDDRVDEQNRGITMKANSVSLRYHDHLINLIDSPGHLQFYSEVAAALRLSDSALLVVDCVEGLSSQTFRVLRQLYSERLPALLVLNKIDKLISHCQMDPPSAYLHLSQLIEQVNAVLGSFIAQENKDSLEDFEHLEHIFTFSAAKKNILFGCALEGWGFSLDCFVPLVAKKLGVEETELESRLWGDFFWRSKTKEFVTTPREDESPLCVDLVLRPIWNIYEDSLCGRSDRIDKMITALQLKVSQTSRKIKGVQLAKEVLTSWLPFDRSLLKRIVEVLPDPTAAQKLRLNHLLQLNARSQQPPVAVVEALRQCNPQQPFIAFIGKMITVPVKNMLERGRNILQGEGGFRSVGLARVFSGRLRRGEEIYVIGAQNGHEAVRRRIDNLYLLNAQYPEGVDEVYAGNICGIGNLEQEVFKTGTISSMADCISFIPLVSQIRSILKVSVSTPNLQDHPKLLEGLRRLHRSDPSVQVHVESSGAIILNTCGEVHLQKCIVDLEGVYAGVPVSISDPIISFRESITWDCFKENHNERAIAEEKAKRKEEEVKAQREKVKEEMKLGAELDEHERLKQEAISNWDSHVEIYATEDLTVEDTRYFLVSQGDNENRAVRESKKVDRRNRTRINLKPQLFLNLSLKTNTHTINTPNLQVVVRAIAMPFAVAQFLERSADKIRNLVAEDCSSQSKQEFLGQFVDKLKTEIKDEELLRIVIDHTVCFGPDSHGSNVLLCPQLQRRCSMFSDAETNASLTLSATLLQVLQNSNTNAAEMLTSIKLGFNLATACGPLCHESMMGVFFIVQCVPIVIDKVQIDKGNEVDPFSQEKKNDKPQIEEKMKFGPLEGQIASAVKDACIQAFLGGGPRLVEPLYHCQLLTAQKYYGSVHQELSRRRARIVNEELHPFNGLFIIRSLLPLLESQNFCFDLLDKTQGTVHAQLLFGGWQHFPEDPFFTPHTAEQLELMGFEQLNANSARVLLDRLRAAKGLTGLGKMVAASDKQRTLKRN